MEADMSRWDVRDYDACVNGIARVEETFGPVEVLVNNAGITRDAMFHKMSPQQWREVIDTNLTGVFNMTHPVWPGMRDRGFGPHRQHLLHQWPERPGGTGQLFRLESGRHRVYQGARPGRRQPQYYR
ncbi:Acetoacetyl CoA reductase [Aphelenchoides besseyi]|nr:Acetoacetyl CoA reductase [Aphelenchoides besseyi]